MDAAWMRSGAAAAARSDDRDADASILGGARRAMHKPSARRRIQAFQRYDEHVAHGFLNTLGVLADNAMSAIGA